MLYKTKKVCFIKLKFGDFFFFKYTTVIIVTRLIKFMNLYIRNDLFLKS